MTLHHYRKVKCRIVIAQSTWVLYTGKILNVINGPKNIKNLTSERMSFYFLDDLVFGNQHIL